MLPTSLVHTWGHSGDKDRPETEEVCEGQVRGVTRLVMGWAVAGI